MNPTQHNNGTRSLLSSINVRNRIMFADNREWIDRIHRQDGFMSLMMLGEIEAASKLMYMDLVQADVMKHNVKKECNRLLKAGHRLRLVMGDIDRRLTYSCCQSILPGCEAEYTNDGGSVLTELQHRFHALFKDKLKTLFICLRQAGERGEHPYPALYACIRTVEILTQTALDVSAFYANMLQTFFNLPCSVRDTENEQAVIAAAGRMADLLGSCRLGPQDRRLIGECQSGLCLFATGSEVVDLLENAELEMYRSYGEYFLAVLRHRMSEGRTLDFTIRRSLYRKLNHKKNILTLLAELEQVPPRTPSEDMYDLSMRLSRRTGPALDEFRVLVFRGTNRLEQNLADEIESESLLAEVADNNGILPLGTLRQLYADTGSLQAVKSKVARMGRAGAATADLLNRINEDELQDPVP